MAYQPLINALKKNITVEEFFKLSPLGHQATENILINVLEKRFIVDSATDEMEELKFLQKKYLGHPRVSLMYLLLAEDCNLACRYCFIENNIAPQNKHPSRMSMETAQQAIKFFAKQIKLSKENTPLIIFYGGEPLLNWPVLKATIGIIEDFKRNKKLPKDTKISLVTNGTLITPEIARFLKNHLNDVAISIDGPKVVTNKNRVFLNNAGVYRKAMQGLKLLRNEGMEPGISCTLSKSSIDHFKNILKWFKDINVHNIGLNIIRPTPQFPADSEYADHVADALIKGYEFLSKREIYEDRMARKVKTFTEGKVYPYDCAGCGNQIVVSSLGKVGICAGFTETKKYFMTDVSDCSFDHRTDKIFLLWSKKSPLATKKCFDCPAIGVCGGGCPHNAELNKKSLDDIFCVHAKKTLEYLIWNLYEQHLRKNLKHGKI
ncbi:MAG: radical SAM protein [bacterium]